MGLSRRRRQAAGTALFKLIKAVEQRSDSRLIQTVLLRSLSQAADSPTTSAISALGYPNYTHFTADPALSDLLVHRAIKDIIARRPRHDAGAG
jgi:ribonuclease R